MAPRWPCRSSPGPRPPRPRSAAAWSPRGPSLCTARCTSKRQIPKRKHTEDTSPKVQRFSNRFLQILSDLNLLNLMSTYVYTRNAKQIGHEFQHELVHFSEQPGLICTRLGPFTAALPRLTDQEHAAATAKPTWAAVKVDRSR